MEEVHGSGSCKWNEMEEVKAIKPRIKFGLVRKLEKKEHLIRWQMMEVSLPGSGRSSGRGECNTIRFQ